METINLVLNSHVKWSGYCAFFAVTKYINISVFARPCQLVYQCRIAVKKFFNTSGLKYKELQLKDKLPAMTINVG